MPTLVSIFDLPSDVANSVRKLKARGFDDLTTYSPAPFPEIEDAEDPKPSGVRLWTLIGGLLGVTTGFAFQIWASLEWPIVSPTPETLATAATAVAAETISN